MAIPIAVSPKDPGREPRDGLGSVDIYASQMKAATKAMNDANRLASFS